MKGILLVSHGALAEGLLDSLGFFFAGGLAQIDCLGLTPAQGPEELREALDKKAQALDTGEGLLIFADLYGGTPANTAAALLRDRRDVTLIAGMNLGMVMEAVSLRERGALTRERLLEAGKKGVVCVNEVLENRRRREP